MDSKAATTTGQLDALADFGRLTLNALATGLAVGVAAGLLVLGLSATAQAASPAASSKTVAINDARTGQLLLHTSTPGQYSSAPRVETEVAIQVTGMIARTRLTQVFHNPGDQHVEGVYVFPLPEKAAVDRLKLQIGERTIEGTVKEKLEARRAYEVARVEGRKASLIEQQRPNLFVNAVANIGPREMVRVSIEYQQALSFENGEYRLRFPLAVTPRYIPAGISPEGMPDEPKASEGRLVAAAPAATKSDATEPLIQPDNAPEGCGAVNPVDIVVVIDAGVPLGKVTSSYHEAMIEKSEGNRTVVYLLKEQEAADRDFELVWSPAPGAAPVAAMFTQAVGDEQYALLMVMPPEPSAKEKADMARIPREAILVIDTSGSMMGAPMEQARAALLLALDTLRPGDRFNVIQFNATASALFPEALPVSNVSISRAREWIGKLKANGGTEMAAALKLALPVGLEPGSRETPGSLRQVIFITDGAVDNEDELFRLIHARLGGSRLFTVGIGSAPNGHFMTKAAQFGRGSFTYIGNLAEVGDKMTQLFGRIEAPVLKDVQIRWADGTPVETFPDRVPDLYLGEPIVVSASARNFAKTVIVSGVRGNQPWSVALTPPPSEGGPSGVGALWARAKIASLMDAQRTGADPVATRAEVVNVALKHHLVSAYTSLVAVDLVQTAPTGGSATAMVKSSAPQGMQMGQIPQTDTESTLQVLLGLLALAFAGMVAVVGRAIPAGKDGVAA